MACSIEEHKKKVNDEMHRIFHQTGTIKIINNTVIITPSDKSEYIKNIKTANAIADERIKEANDWGKKEYGKSFSGFAIKNKSKSDNDKVVINLYFPDALEQAYLYKRKQEKELLEYNNNLLLNAPEDIFKNELFNKNDENVGLKDPNIKSKFFGDSNETTALEILEKIKNSNDPLNLLAKRLLNHSKYNNVKIILENVPYYSMMDLGSSNNPDDKANAYYDSKTNQIHIAKDSYFRKGSSETTILHEIIHSVTYHKLKESPSSSVLVRDFNKLYNYALTQLNKDDFYGLTNKDEFIVALFTDSRLIEKLKDIPASKNTKMYSNLFQELFDFFLSMLNISKSNSLYEQAFNVATHILDEQATQGQLLEDYVTATDDGPLFSKQEKSASGTLFEAQYVFIKRRINRLSKELEKLDKGTDEYTIKESELKDFTKRFQVATEEANRTEYIAIAKEYLTWVDILAKNLPENPDKYVIQDLTDAFEILTTFEEFEGVMDDVARLKRELFPYIERNNLKLINSFNTSDKQITKADVDAQDKDVRWSSKQFGSLADVYHHIVNTIANVIKKAQNTASTKNKMLEGVIQKEVDDLSTYAKDNNMSLEQVYDIFIQESNNTLELTKRYLDGKVNPNYEKIQNTPELKKFYDFYQKVIIASQSQLPYKVSKNYILNKAKSSLVGDLKKLVPVETIYENGFISNEELLADVVPEMFRSKIPADKKSRDLGSGLLEFAAYANNHAALSEVLPQVRLLQEQLKYKQMGDGSIVERHFIKTSDPKKKLLASDSNIYKMTDDVINMQIKGQMKNAKWSTITYKKEYNEEGDLISYKQLRIEDLLDKTLRLNSLLRIGFSPITAFANVAFGDIGNFIEAVGGRFFTTKELRKANSIFFKQINYTSVDKNSNVYKWLEKLNPLQELEDYDLGGDIKLNPKKISVDKALETAYFMQKKGELYLQTTTMIAMLIHDGYMNPDGTNTNKKLTEQETVQLSNKIQKLNQTIHGRYSSREAGTIQQYALARAALQFRKWIPTAIEQRFGDRKIDNRLGVEVEGRYRTAKRVVFEPLIKGNITETFQNIFLPILSSKAALERGNMSELEIYNMRKNMIELILLSAFTLMAAGLRGDDDDKEWRKNPAVKTGLTMLNRMSKDLLFFFDAQNVADISANAIPISALMKDIVDVVYSLPHAVYLGDYKVKKGSLKGTNEFYSQDLAEIIPLISTGAQLQKLLNSKDLLMEY